MNRRFNPANVISLRRLILPAVCGVLLTGGTAVSHLAWADAPADTETKAAAEETPADEVAEKSEEAEEAEEDAPIVIPDGTPEELFKFASDAMRNRGRTREEVVRSARTVIDTAAKIRTLDDVTLETELKAIGLQVPALKFLARFDKDAATELETLMESFADDERAEIRNFAVMEQLTGKILSVRSMDEEGQQALVAQVLQIAEESGISSQLYSLASRLASGLAAVDKTDMAVSLYNNIADRMEQSDDKQIQDLASRARGSARRLGLMGNEIELEGTTGDGEPFDWSAYRGRVVLVDFWASWCGPCRGEIPNMKRNLEAYGDDFAVVGINMDRTVEAMQKCIEEEEIAWVNIVGDEDNGMGWDHPIARYYGVSGIPTAILVDQEGKVVSLSARGKRLDASLAELLGPPKEVEPEAEADSEPAEEEDE
ncbi:TlpA family protein disulfide reductase [Aporhodopirellula aestuarii]|uniref:TlpA family protein disulfide reductase n=1 Tax=Aporhodopirellula aestuarii TaxID=2950107 RepID=A0ABT0UB23_9BACT|nr:TlpA disulfide reductase family protein [Aporhodopirellula aestuarii]MCM2373526.1 TlpA family protein disulfide reductase [Aporhodopirellula aestuarii]